jgi:pyruvate formate lyase activating enzyme
MKKVTGNIHSVETFGTVDGPGVRYVVFMQGCPLKCVYCHNPDTWSPINEGAKKLTVDEVCEDINRYKNFLSGGVTITGGEPFLQKEFLLKLVTKLKKQGFHIAIDTSGFVFVDKTVSKILDNVDLIMMSVKSTKEDVYKQITTQSDRLMKNFFAELKKKNKEMFFRFVLVPGMTDNDEEIENMARIVNENPNISKVEVLGFHQMGQTKWERLNKPYSLKDRPPATAEQVKICREKLQKLVKVKVL